MYESPITAYIEHTAMNLADEINRAQEEYVYVTESGQVYHVSRNCTHLKLSVRQVSFLEAQMSRNENGEVYGACEKCCEGAGVKTVYITSEGDRYHFERECPGLKRTIYCVPVSQVPDYRICSRCAGYEM